MRRRRIDSAMDMRATPVVTATTTTAMAMVPTIMVSADPSGKICSIDMPARSDSIGTSTAIRSVHAAGGTRLSRHEMTAKPGWLALALLCWPPVGAAADQAATETCERIRGQIGIARPADPVLLRTLASRQDCRFTAAEIYRAAHGDRPQPPPDAERRVPDREDDDD